MSWWVSLEDHKAPPICSFGKAAGEFAPDYPGEGPCPEPCYPAVEVTSFEDGGTYVLGGSNEASLNVTYNYSPLYWKVWGGGLKETLDGKRAGDVIAALETGAEKLGTERYRDYWAPTDGNAGAALATLLNWARQYPDAVFRVN